MSKNISTYFSIGVCTSDSEGAVGGAGGEVVSTIAGGKISMDGEGATPPRVRDEDGVEAGKVTTVGEGANFGEADGDFVGEEASVALEL